MADNETKPGVCPRSFPLLLLLQGHLLLGVKPPRPTSAHPCVSLPSQIAYNLLVASDRNYN